MHIGDALVSVNNSILSHMPSKDALTIINDGNIMRKTLSFMNQAEYYRNKVRSVHTADTVLAHYYGPHHTSSLPSLTLIPP